MNIIVCVKQVPDTNEVRIDPVKGTLIREGVPAIMNPDDKAGLEAALELKDRLGAKVTALSMGPAQADAVLREALAMGADEGILISDRAFGGADTWATSSTLAAAISTLPYDLIITGRQAIDGDTAQVGPEIAEHMDYPQVTYAVEASVEENYVKVKRETEEGYEVLGVQMPCLITVTKPKYDPRYPSIKSKLAANRAEIATITAADLTIDLTQAGLKGSPTKVKKTFTPQQKSGGVTIQEESGEASAKKLFQLLSDANLL